MLGGLGDSGVSAGSVTSHSAHEEQINRILASLRAAHHHYCLPSPSKAKQSQAKSLRVCVWVYSLGIVGMKSNQILAAPDLERRAKAPVFVTGMVLALTALIAIELHYEEYKKKNSSFGNGSTAISRRSAFVTRALQAVMLLSLLGSAWYGAAEVVELN